MDKERIINQHFHRSILGYDVEEVDAFLDEIIREMDRREQELGIARLRIKILLEELENHGLIKNRSGDGAKPEKSGVKETAAGAKAESSGSENAESADNNENNENSESNENINTVPEKQPEPEEAAAKNPPPGKDENE